MPKKKIYEQVSEYSFKERNSVIVGGNKYFLFLICSILAIFLLFIGFIALIETDCINLPNQALLPFIPAATAIVSILIPFVWVKAKYPLYKEEKYHYIKAIKKKMNLLNRSFDNDDMYKATVSEFSQPMEWYGSLVLILMFIWMFVDVVNGISFITGIIYGSTSNMRITAEQMYEQYGMVLKILDVFLGVASVASAILTVFAWKALKDFKKSAPKLIISVYAVGLISSFVYVVGWYLIGINETASIIPYLIINAALLIGNTIYFRKRSAWFVH